MAAYCGLGSTDFYFSGAKRLNSDERRTSLPRKPAPCKKKRTKEAAGTTFSTLRTVQISPRLRILFKNHLFYVTRSNKSLTLSPRLSLANYFELSVNLNFRRLFPNQDLFFGRVLG